MSGRDPRGDDDVIVVESFSAAAASDHTVAKSRAIVAGTITGDISRMRLRRCGLTSAALNFDQTPKPEAEASQRRSRHEDEVWHRRFVARTQAQLETWQAKPLDDLGVAVLLLDGVHVGDHCLVVALGITDDGTKHALGLWEGSTENSTVCQSLLANLQSRGLRTDRSLLVILDGSKALRKAVREMFGEAALVQRCQIHKLRNVLDHLPERQRPWVKAILQRAYRSDDAATAKRLLQDLARRLDGDHPSAAESVREGLDETLTIIGLGLSPSLRRSLSTTNAAESLISRTRHVKRNVKRWRTGQMVVRWAAAGVLEAVKGFRRLKGHKEMPKLVAALRARDQQLGLVKNDAEKVA